ncbi:NAD(P)H-binding protein [Glycomyces salinus]|uniref:NAD(P)H-binding protein n=1 Tax=Glycomyces salinus TaxID=980294 RepID=UPI0018EDB025|nr:NAD(P)H-binding protein [Glycomyces salinus]
MNDHSESTILVTGATGKVGRRLTDRLLRDGHRVRPVSRSTTVPFDWFDRTTWDAALEGVSAAYLIAPDQPFAAEEFAAAAERSGVRRLVAQSGRRIHLVSEAAGVGPEAIGMHAAQNAVQGSGLEWTVLQPNNFNQNFSEGDYLELLRAGELALPLAGVTEPFIDVEDIAAVAAAVLTEDGHHGRVYELTGPESLGLAEAVETMSKASGKPMSFRADDPEEHDRVLRSAGVPDELVAFLNVMYRLMREGAIADVADGVERVLGRPAVTFADWAERAAKEGAWN